MTKHLVRLYALTLSVLALFLTWAVVAAHPWSAAASAPKDPRLVALAQREAALRHRAAHVQLIRTAATDATTGASPSDAARSPSCVERTPCSWPAPGQPARRHSPRPPPRTRRRA